MITKVISKDLIIDSSDLTDKQIEVLQFVCDRRTNKEIALMLGISPSAVEQRLQSVRRKFGVQSRASLARAYEKTLIASQDLTGEEYQVDHSISDGHNNANSADCESDDQADLMAECSSAAGTVMLSTAPSTHFSEEKSAILAAVDEASGVTGRIAAITTAAASIALLIILITQVAPGLG